MNLNNGQAFLITSPINISYLSGFSAEQGLFLLLTKTNKFVFADARYIKETTRSARGFTPIELIKDSREWWHTTLRKNKIKTIFFEPYDITVTRLTTFRKLSRKIAQLKPAAINLQVLRAQKNKKEIKNIKKAVRITDDIMREMIKIIRKPHIPLSEQDLTLEIHKNALKRGCTELSFPPIVAFGKNSGVPHHVPSPRRYLKSGDLVLIDMGVKYHDYCADLTRTFFTAPPTTRQAEIYTLVLKTQNLVIKKIRPKIPAKTLYNSAYECFDTLTLPFNKNHSSMSVAPHFTHGLGHGVGLEIHELPNLKPKSPDILKAGNIITIEPGLYFSWGGVRIEDIVIVEKGTRGHTNLTISKKQLKDIILR